jgi:hypothetical protein
MTWVDRLDTLWHFGPDMIMRFDVYSRVGVAWCCAVCSPAKLPKGEQGPLSLMHGREQSVAGNSIETEERDP